VFPLQQYLRELATVLRYTCIAQLLEGQGKGKPVDTEQGSAVKGK
jgi:hypothetical protein